MALTVRTLTRDCLHLTGTVSVRRDVLTIRDLPPPRSLRDELRFIRSTRCPKGPAWPLDRGRHRAGTHTMRGIRTPGGPRDAVVYYPATVEGEDSPVAEGSGDDQAAGFPLIAFSHGTRNLGFPACPGTPTNLSQDYRQWSVVLRHLARWGYIVVSVDQHNDPLISVRVDALSAVIAHLIDENDRGGSLFDGRIRASGICLMGHSTGGGAVISLAAETSLDVAAVATIAPGSQLGDLASVGAPLLIVVGTLEGPSGGNSSAVWSAAERPKYRVVIDGANHFGFTDALCLVPPGDPEATIARRDQQRITQAYLTVFLEAYVRGDSQAWGYLKGTKPVEELDEFNITIDFETDERMVPFVRFQPKEAADLQVRHADLQPRFTGSTERDSFVFTQSPLGGTRVSGGSTVTMHLRAGPVP